MPQIINETSVGGNLGSAVGQGLNQGLQGLYQNRLNQILQQQQAAKSSQFWKGLGLPDQLAQQFGSAPESVQKSLLDRLEGVNIGGQQQMPSPQNMLAQLLQQPGTETGSQPQAPQTGLTIGANPAERRHKEVLAQQAQHHAEKLNAPLLKEIEEKAVPARNTVKLAKEALDIVNTGKAITGVAGRITPEFLQSPEGQELLSKLNQIVLTRSQLGKGVPTRLRLALEQGAKAQIWQQPKVIKSILENMINDPEIQKDIAYDAAREKVLSEHETTPKNVKQLIAKEAKNILKEAKTPQQLSVGSTIDTKSIDAKSIPIGTTGEDESGNTVKWNGTEWTRG